MLPCQKRIIFIIWIFNVHFLEDGNAMRARLHKYAEDPSIQQVVIYPWLNPMYHASYHPSSVRDVYGEARPNGDRSRLFWTMLKNGFRKGKPYMVNPAMNSQTLSGMGTGIELAKNFIAAIGEEGMKQLAAMVAVNLSPGPPGPPGPPGSSWQIVPERPPGSNGEKGDNGQWGGCLPPLADMSQWIKGEKGEKGERGECSCNEIQTTLSPTTTTSTFSPSTPEGPTISTEGTITPTDATSPTTDVQTTPDMPLTTTYSPVITTDESFATTVEPTTTEATTPTTEVTTPTTEATTPTFEATTPTTEVTAPTTEVTTPTTEATTPATEATTPTDFNTEALTTEDLTTTIAGSTTDGLSTTTDASPTPTDEQATITDNPTTLTTAPITTTESQTTTIDVTSTTNEQTTSTDLITDDGTTTGRPTTTIDWPTISTDVPLTTTDGPLFTDTTEVLTTSEGHTTTNEITTIPATMTPAMTTTTDYPLVTEPVVADCSELINHQNATWQSPDSYDPELTSNNCMLSIQMNSGDDANVQKEPICQIRLDFQKFFIAQPNRQSKCATDNFRVFNAENKIPTLCGENSGQHLYVTPRSGTEGVQFVFKFGASPISRYWKIAITLIPCCANHMLPPVDCLQYFNDFGGIVKSFNWMDSPSVNVASNHPRQLANQEYNICFKADSLVKSICYTACLSAGLAFSISQNAGRGPFRAGVGVTDCKEDFLLIANGYDRFNPTKRNDRFCGTIFNPDGNVTVNQGNLIASASTSICSDIKPFQIHYTTNGKELPADVANNGFCLQYEQEYLTKNQVLLLDQISYDLPDK